MLSLFLFFDDRIHNLPKRFGLHTVAVSGPYWLLMNEQILLAVGLNTSILSIKIVVSYTRVFHF